MPESLRPDSSTPVDPPWWWLGRALPAGVRKRLFEPAYYDMLHHALSRSQGRRGAIGLRALLLFVESWRVGLPNELVTALQNQRVRRAAVAVATLLGLSTLIAVTLLLWLYLPKY